MTNRGFYFSGLNRGMCSLCDTYIYDIIVFPLPITNPIHKYVRIPEEYHNHLFLLIRRFYTMYVELESSGIMPDEMESELMYFSTILMERPIIRHKDQRMMCHYTRMWLEYKMTVLLNNLPSIHEEHTAKEGYDRDCAVKNT